MKPVNYAPPRRFLVVVCPIVVAPAVSFPLGECTRPSLRSAV